MKTSGRKQSLKFENVVTSTLTRVKHAKKINKDVAKPIVSVDSKLVKIICFPDYEVIILTDSESDEEIDVVNVSDQEINVVNNSANDIVTNKEPDRKTKYSEPQNDDILPPVNKTFADIRWLNSKFYEPNLWNVLVPKIKLLALPKTLKTTKTAERKISLTKYIKERKNCQKKSKTV
jgi:hypothetical protein